MVKLESRCWHVRLAILAAFLVLATVAAGGWAASPVQAGPNCAVDGTIDAHMLATCRLLGVDQVCKMGGAQAIAALAYGTETVPRVDMIVGPGNAYVAAAKRLVLGTVGIDAIAGPSEGVVICDESAVPRDVAADLLSQV